LQAFKKKKLQPVPERNGYIKCIMRYGYLNQNINLLNVSLSQRLNLPGIKPRRFQPIDNFEHFCHHGPEGLINPYSVADFVPWKVLELIGVFNEL